MQPYPHTYAASARGGAQDAVTVEAPALAPFQTAAPPEFDGPGGVWSPETLLCAAVADCFILSFRGVARTLRLPWSHLECRVEGVLERVERQSQFTRFRTVAQLTIPDGADAAAAHRALEQAERGCLVANSLRGGRTLEAQVITAGQTQNSNTLEIAR